MRLMLVLASLALIVIILWDGFEAMVFPRRVTRRYRLTHLFYHVAWTFWRALAQRISAGKRRETFLSFFGPLSLFGLFATWVTGLIVGFGLLHWALETPLNTVPAQESGLTTFFYLSGVTFFTLGFGDITAAESPGRVLTVMEAGIGFGFMAVIIGYLPVLYQAFSRREATITLLDARAGSPPSAAQFLVRLGQAPHVGAADFILTEWERWAGEVLESHLSFPVLSYYRSQHDNQSWLAALTMMLDTCAVLLAGIKDANLYQAQMTFAMARHVVVDLALIFKTPPRPVDPERLPIDHWDRLRQTIQEGGLSMRLGPAMAEKLAELRDMYEPFVTGLAHYFLFALPPIMPEKATVDNWQTSAWTQRTPGIAGLRPTSDDDHFA